MPSIENVDLGVGYVAPVCLCFGHSERRIVLSPQDKQGRMVVLQPGLPRRIVRDVGLIIEEQIRLDLALARLRQVSRFPFP